LTKLVAPAAYASFENHILNGQRFSREEIAVIHGLMSGEENPLTGLKRLEFEQKFSK
jgi:thymidylate synthase (FAD)